MNHFFDDTPPPCPQCTQNTAVPLVFGNAVSRNVGRATAGPSFTRRCSRRRHTGTVGVQRPRLFPKVLAGETAIQSVGQQRYQRPSLHRGFHTNLCFFTVEGASGKARLFVNEFCDASVNGLRSHDSPGSDG